MHLFCFQLTDNENLNPFLAQWTTSATNDSKSIPKFSYLPKCAIDTFKISPAKYHEYLRFTVLEKTMLCLQVIFLLMPFLDFAYL